VIKDVYSGRIVGYSIDARTKASLAVAALRNAVALRGPAGTVVHSDRGSEYSAEAFAAACTRLGVTQPMGRVGSAPDNAACESFHSTLKVEYVYRRTFAIKAEAIRDITAWITGFYNLKRRHSANNGMSPIDFEEYMAEVRKPSIT
jgi:transposase InsO family protein